MLAATGKAVLSNVERYGAYLDAMTIGKARARLTVEQLRSRLREGRTRARSPQTQQPRTEPTPSQEQGFAHILDDREKLKQLREKAEQQDPKRGRTPPQEPGSEHVVLGLAGPKLNRLLSPFSSPNTGHQYRLQPVSIWYEIPRVVNHNSVGEIGGFAAGVCGENGCGPSGLRQRRTNTSPVSGC